MSIGAGIGVTGIWASVAAFAHVSPSVAAIALPSAVFATLMIVLQ